jgi:transcriptional regulator GlxA family with amidase domain
VDEGAVATSSGVSAGIDPSLALIARLFGVERARQIAAATEYEWHEDPDDDPFAGQVDQAMPMLEALR